VRRGGGVLALAALERTQRHGGSRQGAGRHACPPQGVGRVLRGSARAPTPRASYASNINRGCACRRSGPPQRARGYTRPCRRAADGGWARPHAHPRAEGRPHPPDGEARRAPARTALRVVRSASARTSQCRCGVHGGRTGRPTGRPRGVSRPNREKRMVGESALAPAAAGAATRPRLADRHGRGAPRVAQLDPLSPKPMTAACVANPVGHKRAREGCGAPVGRARQVRRARAGLRLFGPAGVCRWVRPCAGEGPGAAGRVATTCATDGHAADAVPPWRGWGVWWGFLGPPPRRGTGRATVGLQGTQVTASQHHRKTVSPASCTQRPLNCPRRQLLSWPVGWRVWGKGFWSTAQKGRLPTKKKQDTRRVGRRRTRCLPCTQVLGSCGETEPVDCQPYSTAHQPPFASCLNVVGRSPSATGEGLEQAKVNCRGIRRLLLGTALVSVWHQEYTHLRRGSL